MEGLGRGEGEVPEGEFPFPCWAAAQLADGQLHPSALIKGPRGPCLGQCSGHSGVVMPGSTCLASLVLLGAAVCGEWTWGCAQPPMGSPPGLGKNLELGPRTRQALGLV